jgi:hypothetical protein
MVGGHATGLGRGPAQRGRRQRPGAAWRGWRLCTEREIGEAGWLPSGPPLLSQAAVVWFDSNLNPNEMKLNSNHSKL